MLHPEAAASQEGSAVNEIDESIEISVPEEIIPPEAKPVEEIKTDIKLVEENTAGSGTASKLITDFDAHLFSQGTFYKVYDKFGAQITAEGGTAGVRFTTWAPNAESICVIGEFNGWAEGLNIMEKVHDSGLWSLFIPGLK
ncbi:MAG TPA: hypothetical protein DCX92_06920, partial [Bacteroidetes bacterium]|nr:hypothetical protein [Bacteroidota bacterium]